MITHRRLEGWEDRLFEVVENHSNQPCVYGKSDCFTLILDAYQAVTGEKLWDDIEYDDPRSAHAKLKQYGFKSLEAGLNKHLPPQPMAFARRGDICVADYPGALMGGGGIVFGNILVCKSDVGIMMVPRSLMKRAYKVG